MSKRIIRNVFAALAIATATTPGVASARPDIPVSGPAGAQAPTVLGPSQPSASGRFQWDDAGLGAGAVLVLLGAGGTATLVGRRRRSAPTRVAAN